LEQRAYKLKLHLNVGDDSITQYYFGENMETTSVTSKGQVTIPKAVRQLLGIRAGSRIEFALVGDHVEMRVESSPAEVVTSGFGMLKSRRAAVPADFDPATLLKR
jgi:AbrB family looped-hinge helix DNA binding protein